MARRSLPVLLAGIALVAAACGGGPQRGMAGTPDDQPGFDTAGWKTDFSNHSVPLSEFRSGGPPRDGIPPIDEPKFVSQREADEDLGPRDPVLVVEEGGRARAYPVQILVWHEIVNDTLAGRPIGVSYCPLCNSSVVFDRRVEDRTLTFGTTGNLRRSDLVMWDRETESWWQQITAEAVVGELTGTRLKVLPSQTVSWADFKRRFPDGDVLSRETGFDREYGRNPYEGYDRALTEPFLFEGEIDGRLPPKERVAAVFGERETLVATFSRLFKEPVLNEELEGAPIVVMYKRGVASPLDAGAIAASKDVGTAAAFDRRVEGRELTFRRQGNGVVDEQTGTAWDITGRAVAGELEGRRLRPVRHDQQFWFALAAFVPDPRIVG
jgi:hypothetical protein